MSFEMLSDIEKAFCVEVYISTKSRSDLTVACLQARLGPPVYTPGREQCHHQQLGCKAVPKETGQ